MKTVDIDAADTHLSSLVDEAAGGEEIIIAKAGKPVARLMPLEKPYPKFERKPGTMKGLIEIYENFDDPLPPDIAEAFGIIDGPPSGHPHSDLVDHEQPSPRPKKRRG
jgi:prevent-host-death family protein